MEFARQAEQFGFHGVFSYDHLWPMAHPGLPSLSPLPLLAGIGAVTERILLGTLVARIGLEPDDVVVAAFHTLSRISDNRVIAGLGTGDRKSDDENVAFGLNLVSAEVRRTNLEATATRLMERGIETWIGGGGPLTNAIAARLGCVVNIWAGGDDVVRRLVVEPRSSWGGQLPALRAGAIERLSAIEASGAEWAVLSWQQPLAELVELVNDAGLTLSDR